MLSVAILKMQNKLGRPNQKTATKSTLKEIVCLKL